MKKFLTITLSSLSLILSAQTSLIISGIDTTVGSSGYDFYPHTTKWDITVKNSRFAKTTPGGRVLWIGDDNYYSDRANNFDGSVIKGNQFVTSVQSDDGLHGVMASYSINYDIRYNYFEWLYLAIGYENSYYGNRTYSSGGTAYNIFNNIHNIVPAGVDNLKIVNNTFYNSWRKNTVTIKITETNGDDLGTPSTNIQIKNNIFYRETDGYSIIVNPYCDTGLVVDYNVYWNEASENNEPNFRINNTDYTWDEWRALGYDEHSIVKNPDFKDTNNFVPSLPLFYGTDLGPEFNFGLSETSNWSVGNHPDTVMQGARWQVGARIINTVNRIESPKNTATFKILPNPNNGQFSVELLSPGLFKSMNIEIINLKGQIVFRDFVKNYRMKDYNLTNLESGLYYFRVYSSNCTVSEMKFLILN